MVEALTTKNLEIGERCGELEATVADLESSVELSEELEMQQAEDMRELQVICLELSYKHPRCDVVFGALASSLTNQRVC